jgi:post-segregation antitoxin (ccd killing protein)
MACGNTPTVIGAGAVEPLKEKFMTTLELTLNLPDELANQAQAAGLLNSEAIERLLREQLRKRAGEQLRVMLNKADASGIPPMSEDDIQAEIEAYRAERRAQRGTAS